MKRVSFLLIIALLVSSVAYAGLEDKLGNHWSKTNIEEDFIRGYFPYLAEDDFSGFDPNGSVSITQFSKSLYLLLKEYGYETEGIINDEIISREKMIDILGKELEDIRGSLGKNSNLPFQDINTMDETSIDLLRLLYKLEIINGDTDIQFSPNRTLSQAETIIILQRVRGVLNTMETVSFETIGIVQSFNGKEEITVIPQEDKVLVTITKEFPTPGYGMEIKNIIKAEDGCRINFNIEKPPMDSIQLQVITYKTISLEIDKGNLGDMPYNFILGGYNKIN